MSSASLRSRIRRYQWFSLVNYEVDEATQRLGGCDWLPFGHQNKATATRFLSVLLALAGICYNWQARPGKILGLLLLLNNLCLPR